MTPVDAMATCTVRIVAGSGVAPASVGTGFLYSIPIEDKPDHSITLLITNKHVLAGSEWVRLVLTAHPLNGAVGEFGRPVDERRHDAQLPIAPLRVDHPDRNVDLCALFISPVLNELAAAGLIAHHFVLSAKYRLNAEERLYTRAVEPVAMVGYPKGIWDAANNAPIVRRGVTATHPLVRYEGKAEFLIDAACFPGSSGSPVFLYEDGMFRSSANSYSPGARIALLGILYAGPQFTATGELVPVPIPHSVSAVPVTSIPMNLGYVIAAEQIDVLAEEVLVRYRTSAGA
jgi:hypothetical protein